MLNIPCLGFVPITKTRTIFVLSLAAVFAIGVIGSPIVAEAISDLEKTKVVLNVAVDKIKKIVFTIQDGVPENNVFGGYAIVTDEGDVVAVTSHKGVYDNEAQSYPNKNKTFDVCNKGLVTAGFCDEVWSTHAVKLVDNDLCAFKAIGASSFE
ncbi:MAG: hypothetical protein OER82_10750 [Nitrosopumilus sp.]|nr:hypothetical protein [Nitrosopumilus sp.]